MATTQTQEKRFATGAAGRPSARGGTVAAAAATTDAKPARRKRNPFKSKKGILAIVAVLAVGYGAYGYLAPHPVPPPAGGDVVVMDATTLNLVGGHYLKVAISVQLLKGHPVGAFSTSHAAELTIDEFSNRTVDSLSSNAARQQLTGDLLAKLKAAYPGEVYQVFLTQFVTQ